MPARQKTNIGTWSVNTCIKKHAELKPECKIIQKSLENTTKNIKN